MSQKTEKFPIAGSAIGSGPYVRRVDCTGGSLSHHGSFIMYSWVQFLLTPKISKNGIWSSINLGSHSVGITFTNMLMEVVEMHVKEVSTTLTGVLGPEKWPEKNGVSSRSCLGRQLAQPLLRS